MSRKITTRVTLDHIDDWFKIGRQVSNVNTIARSSSTGASALGINLVHADPSVDVAANLDQQFVPPYKRHARQNNPNQTAYAGYYQAQEDALFTEQISTQLPGYDVDHQIPPRDELHDLELDSTVTGVSTVLLPDGMTEEQANAVYANYNMEHNYDSKLPITAYRDEIVHTIEANQVTVIEGPTGSGKTTQVPQYILDHYAEQNKYCNIVVTQPRRIAAVSIARRVCNERNWELGGICGYQIGMDRKASEDTRLVYCTTQVLLQRLVGEKNMQRYTHVILDEVHERDQHSDFCLLVVRKLLRSNSKDVKVVLMSATIETEKFANYFKVQVRNYMEPAPIFTVEGALYKVSEYFVEDLKPLGEIPQPEPNDPMIAREACDLAVRLIMEFDKLEIKKQGKGPSGFAPWRGSVLIFLPGLAEINDLDEALERGKVTHQWEVLPLHSSITGEEQGRVFLPPLAPKRKIILSTNIAESSITVTDVKYVIDFCLTKNLTCDNETYTSLQIEWASKANCNQRRGRAGRVSNGRVYRMVTRHFFDQYIPDYGTPEMQRCPLEPLVLQAKLLDLGEPKAILALALSPPNLDDIEKTVLLLKEVGALTTPSVEVFNPHDGDLTFMGRVLAKLPVDIHIGKLIMLGHVFGLLEECIIIGASLAMKSFFSRPYRAYLEAYKCKLGWAESSQSDCIAMLNAYKVWHQKHQLGAFTSHRAEVEWGREKMLQIRRLRDTQQLVSELFQRLREFNIRPPDRSSLYSKSNHEKELVLKVVLCGSFYPYFFVKAPTDEEQASRTMSGHNCKTTVMVKGLPMNQGPLYRSAIENLFSPCYPNPQMFFEDSRAYIKFPKDADQLARDFSPGVYLALKMRQLGIPLHVYLLDLETARQKMEELCISKESLTTLQLKLRTNRVTAKPASGHEQSSHQVALPGPGQSIVQLNITEVLECGHFWAHYGDSVTWAQLAKMQSEINAYGGQNLKMLPSNKLRVGGYCLAPYEGEFYRARIDHIQKEKYAGAIQMIITMFFVDYGNVEKLESRCLREIELYLLKPLFQVIECELCEIQPSPMLCPAGWTAEAKNAFLKVISANLRAYAKVYSVVHNVLRVELYCETNQRTINVSEYLIKQGFADKTEEGYLSKHNNALRRSGVGGVALEQEGEEGDTWLELAMGDKQPNPYPSLQLKHSKYDKRVNLSGPTNPMLLDFHGMTNVGRTRMTKIERDSVNSIALDTHPEAMYTQLMVASNVNLSSRGNSIIARDTTILPPIPGFPALMALLFSPSAELRTDDQRRRYIGVLCGLGWDHRTEGPAFPDHDMELTFDTHIDQKDIELIDSVRLAVNIAIGTENMMADWGPVAVEKIQNDAKGKLLRLIMRRRKLMEPVDFRRAYHWNQVDPADVISPNLGRVTEQHQLYSLHSAIYLEEDEETETSDEDNPEHLALRQHMEKEEKKAHSEWLRTEAKQVVESNPVTCGLCNYTMTTAAALDLHLATVMHKTEETKYVL